MPEESLGLPDHGAEVAEPECLADHVEEIAELGRGGIGPVAGGAGAGLRSAEPDEHRPAGATPHVADDPVAPDPAAGREIVAADRLGDAAETDRELGGVDRQWKQHQ